MRTMVIAEAGSCHDGLKSWALELVDVAKQAGADAVKFQHVSDPEQYARRRKASRYLDAYRRYALPAAWLPELAGRAHAQGLQFGCTVFLPQDVAALAGLGCDFHKVASFESEAEDLLQAYADLGGDVPVYVSLGMAGSPDMATRILGTRARFLHCVSSYPAPPDELNLSRIGKAGMAGYSDHSGNVLSGALAVASGARVVEAHLRLSCTHHDSPDYPHALNPHTFAQYVANIRQAEVGVGDGAEAAQPSERAMLAHKVRGGDDGEAAAEGAAGKRRR